MPKPYTNPILIDELTAFSITDLKNSGLLLPNRKAQAVITWSHGSSKGNSILVFTKTIEHKPWYVVLQYTANGKEKIQLKIPLVRQVSNLGKGGYCLFLCPNTGERCRKLYLIGKHFQHRKALKGGMYKCQTLSKGYREVSFALNLIYNKEETGKGGRKYPVFYNGRFTKRQLSLMDKQERQLRNLQNSFFFGSLG